MKAIRITSKRYPDYCKECPSETTITTMISPDNKESEARIDWDRSSVSESHFFGGIKVEFLEHAD